MPQMPRVTNVEVTGDASLTVVLVALATRLITWPWNRRALQRRCDAIHLMPIYQEIAKAYNDAQQRRGGKGGTGAAGAQQAEVDFQEASARLKDPSDFTEETRFFPLQGLGRERDLEMRYQFAFVLPVGFVYFGALYGIMLHPDSFRHFVTSRSMWLDSVVLPDPYGLLPCLSALCLLANAELNTTAPRAGQDFGPWGWWKLASFQENVANIKTTMADVWKKLAEHSNLLALDMEWEIALPQGLREIFLDRSVTKLAVSFDSADRKKLQSSFGMGCLLDISTLAKGLDIQGCGLKRLAQRYGLRIEKDRDISISNWAAATLSERQLQYARDDAFFTLWVCAPLLRELPEGLQNDGADVARVLQAVERSWTAIDGAAKDLALLSFVTELHGVLLERGPLPLMHMGGLLDPRGVPFREQARMLEIRLSKDFFREQKGWFHLSQTKGEDFLRARTAFEVAPFSERELAVSWHEAEALERWREVCGAGSSTEAELKGRLGLLGAELRRLGKVTEANALDAGAGVTRIDPIEKNQARWIPCAEDRCRSLVGAARPQQERAPWTLPQGQLSDQQLYDETRTVFARELPRSLDIDRLSEKIRNQLAELPLEKIALFRPKNGAQNRGYGFLVFSSMADAQVALKRQLYIDGQLAKLQPYAPPRPRAAQPGAQPGLVNMTLVVWIVWLYQRRSNTSSTFRDADKQAIFSLLRQQMEEESGTLATDSRLKEDLRQEALNIVDIASRLQDVDVSAAGRCNAHQLTAQDDLFLAEPSRKGPLKQLQQSLSELMQQVMREESLVEDRDSQLQRSFEVSRRDLKEAREEVGGPILLVDDDIFGPLTSTASGMLAGLDIAIATQPKAAQRVPEVPRDSQRFPETPRSFPEIPRSLPEASQRLPKASQTLPEAFQRLLEASQSVPNASQSFQKLSRYPKNFPETPRSFPEAPRSFRFWHFGSLPAAIKSCA
eukprot:s2006_g8.t1